MSNSADWDDVPENWEMRADDDVPEDWEMRADDDVPEDWEMRANDAVPIPPTPTPEDAKPKRFKVVQWSGVALLEAVTCVICKKRVTDLCPACCSDGSSDGCMIVQGACCHILHDHCMTEPLCPRCNLYDSELWKATKSWKL